VTFISGVIRLVRVGMWHSSRAVGIDRVAGVLGRQQVPYLIACARNRSGHSGLVAAHEGHRETVRTTGPVGIREEVLQPDVLGTLALPPQVGSAGRWTPLVNDKGVPLRGVNLNHSHQGALAGQAAAAQTGTGRGASGLAQRMIPGRRPGSGPWASAS
jgi:hypothetical protein